MTSPQLSRWLSLAESHDLQQLQDLLHDDVVFYSPVVHTPQRGKQITFMYLAAAFQTLLNENFRYVSTYESDQGSVLEFETEIDAIHINGVDMITWDSDHLITEFKVMVRPLQAVNMLHAKMKAMLEKTR